MALAPPNSSAWFSMNLYIMEARSTGWHLDSIVVVCKEFVMVRFRSLIRSRHSASHICRRLSKPDLERLEDRTVLSASYLAAEFPGHGVWLWSSSSGSWQQVTAANAS